MKPLFCFILALFLTLGELAMGTAENGFAAQSDKMRTIVAEAAVVPIEAGERQPEVAVTMSWEIE